MLRKALWALVTAVVCLAAPVVMRAQMEYLDVYTVKVKPEKSAEFNALARKVADANRKFNGDHWLATESVYGEGDTFSFVSYREDYASIDKATDVFMGALQKAFGKEGAEKMLHDWENCLIRSQSELRRRRMDLSRKAPTDAAAFAKLIGESRVVRTTAVHVRPGHIADFEETLKELKEAGEKNPYTQPLLVSQAVEGTKGTTFYITSVRSSLGGFDKNPTAREVLGEEGYKKYQHMNAETVESAESTLRHFSPELSNPPEEIAQVAADFWRPKQTVAAASAKPKSGGAKAAEVKAAAADKPQH
jgi:quinol monooxygenase YgiN